MADEQKTEEALEITGITLNGTMDRFQMKRTQPAGKQVVVGFVIDADMMAPGSPVMSALAACFDESVSVKITKIQRDLFTAEDDEDDEDDSPSPEANGSG